MSPLLRRSLAGTGALVVLLALLGLLLGAASAPALAAAMAVAAPAETGVDLPAGPDLQNLVQPQPAGLAARADSPAAVPRADGELWSTFVLAGALVTTGYLFLRGVRRDLRGDIRGDIRGDLRRSA